MITNAVLFARLAQLSAELRMSPGDVFLQPLPLFHIASQMSMSFAYRGAENVLLREFDESAALAAIERHRVTHALLVPAMISRLLDSPRLASTDLSSLRLVCYSAAPIAPDTLRALMEKFACELIQSYGMTETAASTFLYPEDHDPDGDPDVLLSVGHDALGAENAVIGPDGAPAAPGEQGEIVTRGPNVMAGYWRQPDASAEALRGGWMHTGDLGRRGPGGRITITGRVKDMIITGGENVYPKEVEDVLFADPDVLDAAVFGVPDTRWGRGRPRSRRAARRPGRASRRASGRVPRRARRLQGAQAAPPARRAAPQRRRQGPEGRAGGPRRHRARLTFSPPAGTVPATATGAPRDRHPGTTRTGRPAAA
jgi:acyl-CoA synthetase (AMP-forming)/AMP-acid ligase II